jgi:hypothetical protein
MMGGGCLGKRRGFCQLGNEENLFISIGLRQLKLHNQNVR